MHVEKRVLKSGKTTYRVRYWKNGKNKTIPKDRHPVFKSKSKAEAWVKKKLNNVNLSHEYYQEYRDWLETKAYNHIDPKNAINCESFPQHKVDETDRGYKDIITPSEYEVLKSELGFSRDFFIVLCNTGMRFNELFSLSIADISDDIDRLPGYLKERFEGLSKKIYGYLLIESQSSSKTRKRNKKGEVGRKPLKGRKLINSKNGRIIPVTDMETWSIIVDRYNTSVEDYEKKAHLSSRECDYFIFNESYNSLSRDFRKFCDKGYHACRHSYVTKLVGETGTLLL